MTPELQRVLADAVTKLGALAPAVVADIIRGGIISALIGLTFALATCGVAWRTWHGWHADYQNPDREFFGVLRAIFGPMLALVGVIWAGCEVTTLVIIWLAPRAYLIDVLRGAR